MCCSYFQHFIICSISKKRERNWRQVLESKTRSRVCSTDNKRSSDVVAVDSVIVVDMFLMLCRGILMFIVLGLSYVWENRSWWQRRRAHHVFCTCGASLAGDSLHILLQSLFSSRVRIKSLSLALFVSKVSCAHSRLSFSSLWLHWSLFFMWFHFNDILWFIDFRFQIFSSRTFFSFRPFEANCDSDEWKQDGAGNCYWMWSLFKMRYPKKLS
jgi:hypothetical protein